MGQPWYTISSPQEAREVFTLRSKDFDERAFPETFASVVENKGLIFTNGPEHVVCMLSFHLVLSLISMLIIFTRLFCMSFLLPIHI